MTLKPKPCSKVITPDRRIRTSHITVNKVLGLDSGSHLVRIRMPLDSHGATTYPMNRMPQVALPKGAAEQVSGCTATHKDPPDSA